MLLEVRIDPAKARRHAPTPVWLTPPRGIERAVLLPASSSQRMKLALAQ